MITSEYSTELVVMNGNVTVVSHNSFNKPFVASTQHVLTEVYYTAGRLV
jgi:hypothetical protein